jgi:hypothetical protein
MGFLNTLLTERDWSSLQIENIQTALETGLTKTQASTLISLILDCPKRAQATQAPAEAGFYLFEANVYRVQPSKSTGKLYAKILVSKEYGKGSWEYAQGMVYKLAGAEKLTLEVAANMGHAFGICMVCGRTLTALESVNSGIGPICAGRL